jgi:1-aminocyclopropane-1-carboxylate deaminase/D-cysteine desulfhydrase-like pyridoxal-dependent ACC family enzyme
MFDLVHENIKILPNSINLDILRLDLLHPVISGNKWFKLNGYLQTTVQPPATIITFGGAWSNHIHAAAFAARQAGIPSVGFIRGERPAVLSDTLQDALAYGMQLEYLSRSEYSQATRITTDGLQSTFLRSLSDRYPGAVIIPEGGAGIKGIEGCQKILQFADAAKYTHILCAMGTGTMFLGLVASAAPGQTVLGIPVLKGIRDLSSFGPAGMLLPERKASSILIPEYHFGGYARHTPALLDFMNKFYHETGTPSEFVYTGKLFYAAMDLLKNNYFPARSRILLIHSGGLQGNRSLPAGRLDF